MGVKGNLSIGNSDDQLKELDLGHAQNWFRYLPKEKYV